MLFDDIKPRMWFTVIYEEEKFLAKVQHKSTDAPSQVINVLFLGKPLGINTPQSFEKSSFDVEKVYRTEIRPYKKKNKKKNRHESGYGNIEIHFIDISFVKSHS